MIASRCTYRTTQLFSRELASFLPMIIFSKVRLGVSPDVNALATIIIGIVSLGIIQTEANDIQRRGD